MATGVLTSIPAPPETDLLDAPTLIGAGDEPTIYGGPVDQAATFSAPGDQPTTFAPLEQPPTNIRAAGGGDPRPGTGPVVPPEGESGPLRIGQGFGSRYHIISVLGVGGMGAVYKAWDAELSEAVAIKVVRPEITADPSAAADIERRFKRELVLARQVTHKNVVRIHDLGDIDGIKYITMPYVEGSDLATVMRQQGRLPLSTTLRIIKSVVSGLTAAHAADVVHRDLKPANIMIDANDEALIMDFGIARSTGMPVGSRMPGETTLAGNVKLAMARPEATVAGAIVGTVEYMAPEQARGQAVDQRADVYALGLILYDMLAGRSRSALAKQFDELMARMNQPPPPIKSIVPDVPEPLAAIVSRCLDPDPAKRYQKSVALGADLDRLDENGNLIPVKRVVGMRGLGAVVTVLLALSGASWWYAQTLIPPAEHDPVSVLIADFDNQAGDPVFRGALEQALGLAMEGASFITTFSRDEAKNLAQQLKPGSALDAETARVISTREGIKYIISGTIEAKGGRYPISIRAIDPSDGHEVAKASATASGKDGVLKSVGSLAVQLRRALGDTKPRGESLAAMDPVTTVSLEAIQAYARGQELALAGKSDEALAAFQSAIDLDPSLGRAYAGMAVIYNNLKRDAQAQEYFQKALTYVDRMTEREKYRTLGSHYLIVSHNYEKAIENYQELVRLYPADNSGHSNLGLAYLMTGNLEGAVTEGRRAIEIYPRNLLLRTNYSMYAMYAGDFKTAITEANTVLKGNPSFEYATLTLARATLAAGDVEGASAAYSRLRATSRFGASLADLGDADTQMYRGNHRQAARILEAGIVTDAKSGGTSDPAPKYVALAEARIALGDPAGAAEAAIKATSLSRQESVLLPAARVLIDLGKREEVEKIASDLENMLQRQTIAYARLLDGELSLKRNRLATALEALRDSQKRHDSWFAHYALGKTYVQAGHFAEALPELEWCFKRKGLAADAFIADSSTLRYFPPVQYWLARSQEALGAKDAARRNYQAFVDLRADADPPDPLVADARARLAKPPAVTP